MMLYELNEAKTLLATMMQALAGTLTGVYGIDAANLKFAIDDLLSNSDTLIRTATLGSPLLDVFNLAYRAGASIMTLERVRLALVGSVPTTPFAVALQAIGIQMVLAQEVRVYSDTTFKSRSDVDRAIAQLNDGFDAAEELAADRGDSTSTRALIQAHAAIIRDLTTRARPLPNMITYKVGRVLTSHALAQRLYGDASRADQLVSENGTINPAYMPLTGSALSA
jgi:hypothetical protein